MPLTNGANLGVVTNGLSGEPHYTELMRRWRILDSLIQARVIDRGHATPPGVPADGDTYIVAGSPTGAWVGHAKDIARWSSTISGWEFATPKEGWRVYCIGETAGLTYVSSAWTKLEALMSDVTSPVLVLTDAATINVNALSHSNFRVVLGGNRTLANPTGLTDGQRLVFRIIQSTGSHTLAYDTMYKFPAGVTPILTSTAGGVDMMTCQFDSTDGTLLCQMANSFA